MAKEGRVTRAAAAASKLAQEQKSSRSTRTSRDVVLRDASNRRKTRSLASAEAKEEETNAHSTRRRRSARLSKDARAEEQPETFQAAAKSQKDRGRSYAAATRRTTRSMSAKPGSRHRESKKVSNKEKKDTRGRSRSRSSKQVGGTKRSRSRSGSIEEPAKKAARHTSKGKAKGRRSSSRSKARRMGAQKGTQRTSNFMEEDDHTLVPSPFDPKKYTSSLSIYDAKNSGDILQAPEYAADIFQRLFQAEIHYWPQPYMREDLPISTTMRAILVDWLVEVHMKFRLVPDTLYLCVNILDRYLSRVVVTKKQMQLVGITSLLIASKYEEIYPPEVRDCVYITDRTYTRQQVLDTELDILHQLKFMITAPTGYQFLQRFLFITDASPLMKIAATYYMERALQEYDLLEYRPSMVAAAAVCLALNHKELRESDGIDGDAPGVPQVLTKYTGFSFDDIFPVATLLAEKVAEQIYTSGKRQLTAVKRKYDVKKYDFISADFSEPDEEDILFAS